MAERGVTEDDLRAALARPLGQPRPASSGKTWVLGYAQSGRILKVLLSADKDWVVTVAWPDE
jgi:hypothetical protein